MNWLKEAKTDSVKFKKGIIGLEMEDFSPFNCTPNTTYGYIIGDVRFIRDGEDRDRVQFIMTLRFSGNLVSGLGT